MSDFTYLSICSGIEAASVAWHPLGWKAVGFSEIDKFTSAVLAHHWPDVPNLGDMTKHHEWPITIRPDLIVGGTPCQAFSLAGLRQGLADPRGNLTLVFLSIIERYRPQWVVWENVPGVLSDKTGAFGAFLGGLGQLGYGFAYRVFDAQYFGVAQRRRRVFVVGCLDWQRAAAVLFERDCMQGNPAPRRKKREDIAGTLGARASSGGGFSTDFECSGGLQPIFLDRASFNQGENAQYEPVIRQDGVSDALVARGPHAVCAGMRMTDFGGYVGDETASTMKMRDYKDATDLVIAFAQNSRDELRKINGDGQLAGALAAQPGMKQQTFLATPYAVRRLTPTECERLQGFPDGHTAITFNNKPAADGPRYKALGNSMAVPVMAWIGERINRFTKI